MPQPLSKMERRILDYLVDYLRRNTYQPSIREIGTRFGIKSTKTVSEYLQALADKGHIERLGSRSRAVRILGLQLQDADAVKISYLAGMRTAVAAASGPVGADEMIHREIEVSPGAFFQEVSADAAEMGIREGDLVLVEPLAGTAPRSGDLVVARVGLRTVVERYVEADSARSIEPGAGLGSTRFGAPAEDVEVLGRVSGFFRSLPPSAASPE